MNEDSETKYHEDISVTNEDTVYKIGDLAREFNVTLRTLRFYEDRGLINPARLGTTRLYSPNDKERLRIALFCKRIGLTLTDIHKILELHEASENTSFAETQIKDVYTSQLKALEQQQIDTKEIIADLQRTIKTMEISVNATPKITQ